MSARCWSTCDCSESDEAAQSALLLSWISSSYMYSLLLSSFNSRCKLLFFLSRSLLSPFSSLLSSRASRSSSSSQWMVSCASAVTYLRLCWGASMRWKKVFWMSWGRAIIIVTQRCLWGPPISSPTTTSKKRARCYGEWCLAISTTSISEIGSAFSFRSSSTSPIFSRSFLRLLTLPIHLPLPCSSSSMDRLQVLPSSSISPKAIPSDMRSREGSPRAATCGKRPASCSMASHITLVDIMAIIINAVIPNKPSTLRTEAIRQQELQAVGVCVGQIRQDEGEWVDLADFIILLMSLNRNRSFFTEYARSGYQKKINPEIGGVAQRYYKEKKQHYKVHQVKDKLQKQVAYMERMEKKMELALQRKQTELKQVKQTNTRLQNEARRKEWLQQRNSQQLSARQEVAARRRSEANLRLGQAQSTMLASKRSMAELNRGENNRIKELRTIKQAKEWDANRSRVSQIQSSRRSCRDKCNQFYQQQSTTSLSNYKAGISKYRAYENHDQKAIQQLERKLSGLSQTNNKTQSELTGLKQEIKKFKRESKLENSLLRSSMARSRSSLGSHSRLSQSRDLSGHGLHV